MYIEREREKERKKEIYREKQQQDNKMEKIY